MIFLRFAGFSLSVEVLELDGSPGQGVAREDSCELGGDGKSVDRRFLDFGIVGGGVILLTMSKGDGVVMREGQSERTELVSEKAGAMREGSSIELRTEDSRELPSASVEAA